MYMLGFHLWTGMGILGIESSSSPVDSIRSTHSILPIKYIDSPGHSGDLNKFPEEPMGLEKRWPFPEPLYRTEDRGKHFLLLMTYAGRSTFCSVLQVPLSFQRGGLCGEASLKGAASTTESKMWSQLRKVFSSGAVRASISRKQVCGQQWLLFVKHQAISTRISGAIYGQHGWFWLLWGLRGGC